MNFTKFLQRWFGLKGNLLRRPDRIKGEDPCDDFTKKGWDAWGRFLEMVSDMEDLGLLDKDNEVREKVWDIVYNKSNK